MKKLLFAALLGLFVFASCSQKAKEVTEEPAAEAVDTIEVVVDSTAVAADTVAVEEQVAE